MFCISLIQLFYIPDNAIGFTVNSRFNAPARMNKLDLNYLRLKWSFAIKQKRLCTAPFIEDSFAEHISEFVDFWSVRL